MLSLDVDPTGFSRARTSVTQALGSGRALEKFGQMVEAQGGDPRVIDNPALLPRAAFQEVIESRVRGVCFRREREDSWGCGPPWLWERDETEWMPALIRVLAFF